MSEDLPLFIKETARKVVVSKFNFYILKLWEFARLFATMACVNLVFPSQKLNSNGTLQRDTREFNAAFSQKIPSVSLVQFTVQMSKLNGIGKTHRERIFVVKLKLKLRSLFHYEKIARENSDIKWIAGFVTVPSKKTINIYISFWEGTVTNLAIWLVPYPVSIFLSLPTGHGNAFVSRQVHPNFRCHYS